MKYAYTVITSNYDNLRPVTVPVNSDERYVCFTDRPRYVEPWLCQAIPPVLTEQRRASRIPKITPHLVMPDAESSVYMDGAFTPNIMLTEAVSLLDTCDIGLFLHPTNKSIHDEYQFYINLHGAVPDDVEAQYRKYVAENLPVTGEFYAGGLIIRKHNQAVEEFNELWMKEYMHGSQNDQFSLYYAVVKSGVKVKILGLDNLWDKRWGYCLHSHEGGHNNQPYDVENKQWERLVNRIKEVCE